MGVPNLIVVYDAQCYLETLFPSDLSLFKDFESTADIGKLMKSMKTLTIPTYIAGKNINLTTDVIETDIPLLISKGTMKKSIPEMNLPMTKSTFLMLKYLFNLVAQDIIVYQ